MTKGKRIYTCSPQLQPQQQQPPQLQPQQQQPPQLQPQMQQQQAGVNPFTFSHAPQPAVALAPPQPQMAMVAAPSGSQPANQWQQSFVQQPAQNLGMPNAPGQYVAPIPPYAPGPQQGHAQGKSQDQHQVTPPASHQVQQQPSYGVAPTYQPNPGLQPQVMRAQQQQQGQQQGQRPPKPDTSLDDFFGDFSSNGARQTSESSRPTTVIQTGGVYETDNVSVLSKNTIDNRAKAKKLSPLDDPNFAPSPPRVNGIEAAKNLALHAPSSANALPDFEKVTHSGYALARISFRSIVIKKWKQIFWVTYGTSKILIFRSNADFEDWMANPYLTKNQRDFLVKLEVDFVQDAYKANVRGYQVTNIRCKNYQNKLLHQFKLERWMDYGPTIAAAFASQNEKDVFSLRVIISEMMKRCPQDRGLGTTNQSGNTARTYDSGNGYGNEAQNYNGTPGRHYISGTASAGAVSESGSVRSARTRGSYGGASTGPIERMR